jgi:glycosyltransferase involved in cell wall biosynthesis
VTAVHQFVPALLPRDATGDHTLALRQALRDAGFESDIYVEAAHDDLWHHATYFERYPERARPGDILLYQLSTASPVAEFLLTRPERVVLDYHNITPSGFYDGWEDHTSAKVALARLQMAELAPAAVLGIADSAFNAAELKRYGCSSTEVIPILAGIDDLEVETDPAELARLGAAHGEATVLLFVGRISPNKTQHHLVEALWLYRRWYDPAARLHLVGPAFTDSYVEAVFAFAAELGLADAVRHGEDLSDAELAAWYADADVFVCLSEHEGFCIPLLEAMRSGLPIVAYAAGAVPETLGDAGVLLDSKRPSVVAAAIDRVRGDRSLADQLRAAGHRRLVSFAPATTRARFVDVLGALDEGGLNDAVLDDDLAAGA